MQERDEPSVVCEGEDASLISWRERDYHLRPQESDWGKSLGAPWREAEKPARYFKRTLNIDLELDKPGKLDEYIVRFPSAPIYGINRKDDYSVQLPERPNLHTLRVLMEAKSDVGRATRVFILHNGLNETANLSFYYRLMAWILKEGERKGYRSAFLLVPFPGHLMHAPFAGPFAQTPLSRYLADSGDLFRQFLRYMVEMRWLLSLLVRNPLPDWSIGAPLLNRDGLEETLHEEWASQREYSKKVWEKRRDQEMTPETEQAALGADLEPTTIGSTLDVLKRILGLSSPGSPDRMPVHVLGYSLGGFLAQSVFFAWPNLVASCSTICSGGAIRALSPTAFANSEEWQAVLHALRPELEESMLAERILRKDGRIVGLPEDQFGYYQRIFDQVFLQEDKGSYKARLSEYGTRMLFVSGGEDPIVRTHEVLDASPKEGITMLSVANLTHFLGEEPRTDRETAQREFWLPEAGGLIGRAATRAEKLHGDARADAFHHYQRAQEADRAHRDPDSESSTDGPEPRQPSSRDLASPKFEDALDWVIDGVTTTKSPSKKKVGSGWLFICRASLPAAFLGAEMRRASAAGLHHHDVNVQKYAAGLARRVETVDPERLTLILPANLRADFVESGYGLVDPHSDAPGYLTTKAQRRQAWDQFREDWAEQTRWLEAGPLDASRLEGSAPGVFAAEVARWQEIPAEHLFATHLPDVWISIDGSNVPTDAGKQEGAAVGFIDWVRRILEDEPPVREAKRPIKAQGILGKKLEEDLEEGVVRIVRVSGAELNPRYRGSFEQSFWPSILLLAHCAAALVKSHSEPEPETEDSDSRVGT